jgi:dienelactone hydrolase
MIVRRFRIGHFAILATGIHGESSSAQVAAGADTTAVVGEAGFEFLRDFFEYDHTVPLNAEIVERDEAEGYVREKVVFRGVRDSRVPAYLAIPESEAAPHAGVLLIHGVGGSKSDWWQESFHSGEAVTRRLLSDGFAVMTLDVPYHGERLAENDFESPEVFLFQKGWLYRARDMIVASVVEHRRAIDYLESRPEIDAARSDVIGYSMGGMMAFHLAALHPRVDTVVACVPPLLKEPYSAMTVRSFAPRVDDKRFLMMIGKDDRRNYSVDDAREVFELVNGAEKDFVVFESGHQLPREWTDRAANWIDVHLR